jgi:4-hydroxybenzoate polyprenyltransferase
MLRLQNLAMVAVGQLLVGFKLLQMQWWSLPGGFEKMGLLVLATLSSAAGGYVINDYYDVKIDVLNKPGSVVVGKYISRRWAMIFHLLLILTSLLLSYPLGLRIMATVGFCSAWLWLYSNSLKRLPFIGNFSVAVLVAVSLYLPSALFPPAKDSLLIFCLFAFFISLVREIVKDMEDMKGDTRHGCKTLPIIWGIRRTKAFIYWILGLFVAIVFASLFKLPAVWFLFSLGLGGLLIYFVRELKSADTIKAFGRISLLSKWIMLAGMVSILFV